MNRELFAQAGLFRDLDDESLEGVAELCRVDSFRAGDYIFHEGDEGDRLYIVETGEVRISRDVPGAGEEAVTVLKRGACFGEMSVLDQSARSMDAIANTRCTLVVLTREDFTLMLESDVDLANKVLWSVVHILCERLRMTNETLRSLMVMAMF